MPIGFQNITNVTLDNITSITNGTEPTEFFINVNQTIYNGWLWFILLSLLWFVIYKGSQDNDNQPLTNAMYASATVSLPSFFFRAVEISRNGLFFGLLTDFQLWVFPVATALIATYLYMTKNE